VDPIAARAFLTHPETLLALDSPLIGKLRGDVGLGGLVCLGGFLNERREYEWGGHLLELDATAYDWGTVYELEVGKCGRRGVRGGCACQQYLRTLLGSLLHMWGISSSPPDA
jgi:hypothetical protein